MPAGFLQTHRERFSPISVLVRTSIISSTHDSSVSVRHRFGSLEQEAYLALWRTYDRLRALEEAMFDSYNLTAQQYNLLRLLRASGPESVPTLSLVARSMSRAPDITRMLDKLENRNLIVRSRSASDRCAVLDPLYSSGGTYRSRRTESGTGGRDTGGGVSRFAEQ